MKQKIIAGMLAVMMLMTMLPTTAFAAVGDFVQDAQDMVPQTPPPAVANSNTLTQSDVEAADPLTAPQTDDDEGTSVPASASYEVSSTDELRTALTKIAAGEADEAVIVLKNDIIDHDFSGIQSKKITLASIADRCYTIDIDTSFTGDITLDNVKLVCHSQQNIFANGHIFETTSSFQGFTSGTPQLYGGGSEGNDVTGDTHLILRGDADFSYVTGGGLNSDVSGSTYILVDDIRMQTGNLTGGGRATNAEATATVGGDTHIDLIKGWSGYLYGGGRNETTAKDNKEIARVYGDTFVTTGEAGAQEYQAYIGTAMASCGGSYYSTVTNTHFTVLPGTIDYTPDANNYFVGSGSSELYGAGLCDLVLGTVSIDVKRGGCGSRIGMIYGGSYGESYSGSSEIRNQDNETYAVHIVYENDDTAADTQNAFADYEHGINAGSDAGIVTAINGDVLIDVNDGDFTYLVLDSYNNDSTINGDATLHITGGRAAQIEGNTGHWNSDQYSSYLIYDGCGTVEDPQESGYLYKFEKVTLENAAQVSIDGDPAVFPDFSSTQRPFYSVKNLRIEGNSKLTTRDSTTIIKENVSMDHGTWHTLGYLYIYGETDSTNSALYFDDFFALGYTHSDSEESDPSQYVAWNSSNDKMVALESGYWGRFYGSVKLDQSDVTLLCPTQVTGDWSGGNSTLRLPAVTTNYNGTDSGGDIPVIIDGQSTGITTVYTVDPDNWQTLQAPAFGDNYILSAKNGDAPTQSTFLLGNEDALQRSLFLKRVNDADTSDDCYYMWQVATGITVFFDKNGGDTEAAPRIASQDKMAGSANHFDLPTTEPTRAGYLFNGWNTKKDGTGEAFTAETDVTDNLTVYAQWKPDEAYAVKIAPMDLTIYVGGEGYHGVIGEDGEFSDNDLPEIGFYLTLPDDVNAMLSSTDEQPVDLSGTLRLTYDDEKGTTRSWSLELYGDESKSRVTENGHRVYIYKLLSSRIDGGEETVPARVQFTRADGSVMTDSQFDALITDQFRNYKISFFPGLLDEQIYKATFTTTDGRTFTRPIKLGTGTLKVRGNNDTTYRAIEDNTTPSVDPQDKDIMLVSTAQANTQYYINNSGVTADPAGVRLLVDHSLDDALLSAYIDRTSNTEGKYSYQFRYLDLVDTHNGNAYVMMGEDQKMDLYWPVPSDAKADSEFHIIHFKGIDRDSNDDVNDLLTTRIPEELTGETVTIDGQQFVKFSTGSFSPFALLYEKGQTSGGSSGSSSGGGHGSRSDKYTLHYVSNGGTAYPDERYTDGTTVTLDKTPSRESYAFTGWYADKDLTDRIGQIRMTGDKTVYAGWKATGVPAMLNGDDHYAYVVGYPDGTVRPNADISRAEVAAVFFRLLKAEVRDGNLTADCTFQDVYDGQWWDQSIATMAKLGVLKGRSPDCFDPEAPITRAEFATICARFDTGETDGASRFTDISGHWAEQEIQRAASLGWIAGDPDGRFRPDDCITRAEAMAMIDRVLCRLPRTADDLLPDMTVWPDNKPTDWYYLPVQEATNSHDFDRVGEVNETWTKLTAAPDWSRYR